MQLENVLVVGGSGFIGRHFLAALARQGIKALVPIQPMLSLSRMQVWMGCVSLPL